MNMWSWDSPWAFMAYHAGVGLVLAASVYMIVLACNWRVWAWLLRR